MDDAIDDAAEALYAAPVSAFTKERKRLADEAKAAGDKKAAAAILELPKPSVSAWVVNMLHREGALAPLFAAATKLRSGVGSAAADQRAAITRLRARAAEILTDDGHAASPAVIQRVTVTLQALAATGFAPDAPGRLVADRDPPGFETMAGVELAPAEPSEPDAPKPKIDHRARQRAEEERARKRRAASAARQEVLDRHVEVSRLRSELARAEADLAQAERNAREAEAALEEQE